MNGNHIFVDTNILVYAHDQDAKRKHLVAREKVSQLWRKDLFPSISVQVLQEFFVNLIKKKVPLSTAAETIGSYLEWDVVDNDRSLMLEGIRQQDRWKVSFWDALILAAAKRAKASLIWTEDLNTGQNYDGVLAVNPLEEG